MGASGVVDSNSASALARVEEEIASVTDDELETGMDSPENKFVSKDGDGDAAVESSLGSESGATSDSAHFCFS